MGFSAVLECHNTGYTVSEIPDMTGKVAVITGGSSGIGQVTCLELCRKGARVFMATRSQQRAQEAIDAIQAELKGAAKIEFVLLDLADLKQVKAAAEGFMEKNLAVDILINNAAIMACPFELTKDGIESQFAVNYLGHFLFTQVLMPAVLKAGKGARVVNLSSCAHLDTPAKGFDFDAIKNGDKAAMNDWERYAISKVAMILFTHGIHKRYADKGVYTNALHPGFVRTGLLRGSMGYGVIGKILSTISFAITYPITIDAHRGALTSLYCATHPDIESKDVRDQYFVPIAKLRTEGLSDVGKDYEVAEKLWTFSEEMLKEKGITK